MSKSCETDFVEQAGHLVQPIKRRAVGFSELGPECMEREHRLFDKPVTPSGLAGLSSLTTSCLSSTTNFCVKSRILAFTTIRLFAFNRDNAVAGPSSSDLTEQFLRDGRVNVGCSLFRRPYRYSYIIDIAEIGHAAIR